MSPLFLGIISATMGAALILAGVATASAADMNVMATQAVKAMYVELMPGFELSTQHKVSTSWVESSDIVKRIKDGGVTLAF